MILFIVLLSINLAFAQKTTPQVDPNKFTVCTITINSDNEKKVFESQIKKYPKKFNPIVELTDMGEDDDWFDVACSSGLRCDQLVISGHFGGTFFGESEKSLSMSELESKGCSKTCEGILGQPYEVFLMGCNTLASKEMDHRSPAQYLQVLLNDGIPRAQAEMVVESRYGQSGDDFKSKMQRAFGGEIKQLYGFDSVGPSGKNVEGFLKNYFSKIEAPKHLEKLQAKRLLDKVEMGNALLASSLKATAFAQCGAGGGERDPVTERLCILRNSESSTDERIEAMIEAFTDDKFLIYLPAITQFLKEHPVSRMNDEQKKRIQLITNNEVLKKQVIGLLKTNSLSLLLEWSEFAESMGFISESERESYLSEKLLPQFQNELSIEEKDIICSSFNNMKLPRFPFERIKRKLTEMDMVAMDCMGVMSESYIDARFEALNDPKLSWTARGSLSSLKDITPHIEDRLIQAMGNLNTIENGSYLIAHFRLSKDPDFQVKLINSIQVNETEKVISEKANYIKDLLFFGLDKSASPVLVQKLKEVVINSKSNLAADDLLLLFVNNHKKFDGKIAKDILDVLDILIEHSDRFEFITLKFFLLDLQKSKDQRVLEKSYELAKRIDFDF